MVNHGKPYSNASPKSGRPHEFRVFSKFQQLCHESGPCVNLAMALQQEKDILSQVGAFPQPTETRNGEMTNGYPHDRPIHRAIPSLRNVYQSNILFCEIVCETTTQ